jgi:hypothetical protein
MYTSRDITAVILGFGICWGIGAGYWGLGMSMYFHIHTEELQAKAASTSLRIRRKIAV